MTKKLHPELSPEQRQWLESSPHFPSGFSLTKASGATENFTILDRTESGHINGIEKRMGKKGFVLKVKDTDSDAIYAAKFCVPEDYAGKRTESDETRLASILREAQGLFAAPFHAGKVPRFPEMPGTQESLICFISEWIEGETLESRCSSEKTQLSAEFIVGVAHQILKAITYLARKNLKHDDLHWGNVMIRPPNKDLILTEADAKLFSVCLIDMGSLKPNDQPTAKSKDDYLSFVHVLHQIYNAAWVERSLVVTSPKFFQRFKQLLEAMLEEDPTRYYPTPESLAKAFEELEEHARSDYVTPTARSFEPFEGISAEHLADDEILLQLFNQSLPWFRFILEPKPVVLTGPRGCGKSMLFRYLSATTQAKALTNPKTSESALPGFGVYISCATHLQNNLVWITREKGRAKRFAHSISTYFQLVIARELLRALGILLRDPISRSCFDLRETTLDQWINWINNQFDEPVETARLPNESRVIHYAEDLDRARIRVHKDMLHNRKSSIILSDGFLGSITEKLAELNPIFQTYPVIFLLDDYTENRLGSEVQATLNRIIFERRASHYFKISCERMGFNATDIEGVKIDAAREYEEIDAGQYAVEDCKLTQAEEFLRGLINTRLRKANWKGTCESLIGTSEPYSHDLTLAKYIRNEGSRQGRHFYYYGMTHLARLWSGDIATILQIVKDMCVQANVNPETQSVISKKIQHDSIVAISKAYRDRIKDLHPFGFELARIIEAYGSMARNILVQGQLDRKDNPRRLYRLEMTMKSNAPFMDQLEKIDKNLSSIVREILRRSIFHPLRNSRGKEGPSSTTIRWELRQIYLPSFGLSLERGDSYLDIKELDDFIKLIVNSETYCEIRQIPYMLGSKQDRYTASLFGDKLGGAEA